MSWERIFSPEILVFMIPIVGIICGCILGGIGMYFKHAERIAKIDKGARAGFGWLGYLMSLFG